MQGEQKHYKQRTAAAAAGYAAVAAVAVGEFGEVDPAEAVVVVAELGLVEEVGGAQAGLPEVAVADEQHPAYTAAKAR